MREPDDKLSHSEEQRLLEVGRRVFAEHSPNPARTGCPPQDTLRAMAFRSKQLAEADLPLQHLTICSPCFQDYSRYRRQARNQKILQGALAAAIAIVVIGAAVLAGMGRGWFQRPAGPLIAATLDLRPLSPTRGEEPSQAGTVLTLPRGRLQITIQLPVGSEDGTYDVAVMQAGRELQLVQGAARAQDSVMVLTVQMDLRSLGPGRYAFGVRRLGSGWQEYPLRLE
jgi:hypothetical protein